MPLNEVSVSGAHYIKGVMGPTPLDIISQVAAQSEQAQSEQVQQEQAQGKPLR